MVFVPPNAGEKFYACLLLLVAMSICSFADLRSFAGTTYPTFQDACLARGLLADDSKWKQALEDGQHMHTGWKTSTDVCHDLAQKSAISTCCLMGIIQALLVQGSPSILMAMSLRPPF
jgi:hypothetical protein